MINILNPFGDDLLDYLYYLFALFFGTGLFLYLVLFRPKQKRLVDAYLRTGIDTVGVVTHRKVIIRRSAYTRMERGRSYHIRFAYKEPGSLSTVYVKDFVTVKREVLMQRLLPVVLLPGQPTTGTLKTFIQPYSDDLSFAIAVPFIISVGLAVFDVLLFALLSARFLTDHCVKYGNTFHCGIGIDDIVYSIVVVFIVGFVGAWLFYRDEQSRVPGKVFMVHQCPRNRPPDGDAVVAGVESGNTAVGGGGTSNDSGREPPQTAVVMGVMPALDNDEANNRREAVLPMAQAVAILDASSEEGVGMLSTTAEASEVIGAVTRPHDESNENEETPGAASDSAKRTAATFEIV